MVITANHETIVGDGLVVHGNYNTITGRGVTVKGDNNNVTGSGATVTGNKNVVKGTGATVRGKDNTVEGTGASVVGIGNRVNNPRSTPRASAAARRTSVSGVRGVGVVIDSRRPSSSPDADRPTVVKSSDGNTAVIHGKCAIAQMNVSGGTVTMNFGGGDSDSDDGIHMSFT